MIVQDVNLVAGSIPAKITDAGVVSSLQTLAQVLNPLAATGIGVQGTAAALAKIPLLDGMPAFNRWRLYRRSTGVRTLC